MSFPSTSWAIILDVNVDISVETAVEAFTEVTEETAVKSSPETPENRIFPSDDRLSYRLDGQTPEGYLPSGTK